MLSRYPNITRLSVHFVSIDSYFSHAFPDAIYPSNPNIGLRTPHWELGYIVLYGNI